MTPKQRLLRSERIRNELGPLIGLPAFESFIDCIRDMREVAIQDACMESTVASQRASMAAIGEIRAYKSILDEYDQAIVKQREQAARDQDSADRA